MIKQHEFVSKNDKSKVNKTFYFDTSTVKINRNLYLDYIDQIVSLGIKLLSLQSQWVTRMSAILAVAKLNVKERKREQNTK